MRRSLRDPSDNFRAEDFLSIFGLGQKFRFLITHWTVVCALLI